MRGRGLVWVLAGALAVVAFGVGCGSGDGGDSSQVTATVVLAKPAFIKKAEVVCTKNYERVKKDYEEFVKANGGPENAFGDPDSKTEYAETVILPQKEKTVEELRALGAPKGDEKQVGELIDAYEEGIEVGEEEPLKVMSSQGVFAYATFVASGYGLTSCRY
jgi:hypothetical protein